MRAHKNLHKTNKHMAHLQHRSDNKQKISLYTIMEIQSQQLTVNEEVWQVYENIRIKRKQKLIDLCDKKSCHNDLTISESVDLTTISQQAQIDQAKSKKLRKHKQRLRSQLTKDRKKIEKLVEPRLSRSDYIQDLINKNSTTNSKQNAKTIEYEGGNRNDDMTSISNSNSINQLQNHPLSHTIPINQTNNAQPLLSNSNLVSEQTSEKSSSSIEAEEEKDSDGSSNCSHDHGTSKDDDTTSSSDSSQCAQGNNYDIDSDDQVDAEDIVDYYRHEEWINNIELVTQLETRMYRMHLLFDINRIQYSETINKVKDMVQFKTAESMRYSTQLLQTKNQ